MAVIGIAEGEEGGDGLTGPQFELLGQMADVGGRRAESYAAVLGGAETGRQAYSRSASDSSTSAEATRPRAHPRQLFADAPGVTGRA